jgi:hypothetical protein
MNRGVLVSERLENGLVPGPEGYRCVCVLQIVHEKHPRITVSVGTNKTRFDRGGESVFRRSVYDVHAFVRTGNPTGKCIREVCVTYVYVCVEDGIVQVTGRCVTVELV